MSVKSFSNKILTTSKAGYSALGIGIAGFAATLIPSASSAAGLTGGFAGGATAAHPGGTPTDLFGTGTSVFSTIANTLVYIIGAVSVLFLIIGGLRYVISNGDPKAVTAAKDTILYAIIGVIIAVLAYSIIHFVLGQFLTS